ncbi:uncharacterized protein IL334_006171 [Kwoniella shivajii]|uniref:Uncharacterized protein n=1 Tax=Kwoniella shivajii TaxID=564305 RepID=A0ABZ1D577_9TREE|nr:hypothetical protein IL334_006171 [Kwoniella shivajii]
MSLTISVAFTILTYDPPSTPISYIGLNRRLPDPQVQYQPSHRSTPPKESKSSGGERPDKTPSARAKVLPWVQGIDVEEETIPDGMFGPYPSRPQSMAENPNPNLQSRHPFAYSNVPTLPFAAIGAGHRSFEDQRTEHEPIRSQRPDSEVLSRGAGMRAMAKPAQATPGGDVTPGGSSIGMGTFGLEGQSALGPAGIPLPKSKYTNITGSPKKTQYITRKAPPTAALPPDPPQTKPDSDEQQDRHPHHEHKPHHDYPFSHAEAQAKQLQAMEEARAAALAQLEAAQRDSAIEMEQEMLAAFESHMAGEKGPRQTYDTMDSGPSFGHLLHQSGMPLSARPSAQFSANTFNNPDFFPIPFGVPMGMSIPRPLLVMRDSAGAGLGLGLGSDLLDILGHEGGDRHRGPDAKSAFVETVVDEEDFGIPSDARTASPAKTSTPHVRSSHPGEQAAARTESGLLEEQPRSIAQTRVPRSTRAPTEHIKAPPVASKAPSVSPSQARSKAPTKARTKAPTVMSEAFPCAPSDQLKTPLAKSTAGRSQAPNAIAQQTVFEYPDHQTIYSQVRTKNTPTIIPSSMHQEEKEQYEPSIVPSNHESVAPTTVSNVKQLVAESRFHDETLCQLLDAARLNLIGDEAKKALQRAARARVIELRDLRERGEIEEGLVNITINEEPKSNQSTPRKDKRAKSKERSRKKSSSEKTETVVPTATQEAPAWARDIMGRLAAIDARFQALEAEEYGGDHMGRPSTHLSQVTQDIPGNLIDELMFHEMPSSGFTHGIKMPQGLTQSILFPQHTSMPSMPGQASAKAATHYTHQPLPTYPAGQSGYAGHPDYAPAPVYVGARSAYTQQAPTVADSHRTYRPPTQVRSGATVPIDGNGNPAEIPTWGSDVEIPQASDNIAPPQAPTINILAPTESGLGANGRPSTRAPSPSVRSRGLSRAGTQQPGPDHVDVTVITEQALPEAAVPNPLERDLPAPPSESIRSHRPTPPSKSIPLDLNTTHTARTPAAGTMPLYQNSRMGTNADQTFPAQSGYIGSPDQYPPTLCRPVPSSQVAPTKPATTTIKSPTNHQMSDIQMNAHNVYMSSPKVATPPRRDMIHIIDPLHPPMGGWKPWDMLTQRLYSWALIAEEKSFVRALEEVSLGRQVEEFPLSIFLMMTYKRLIRRNLSENPPVPCDKLFVPPNIASAINIAVHARRYHDAKEILLELWDSMGNDEPPRVIVALAPLGNDPDQWAAHRYDLITRHLTTYRVSHLDEIQTDGRSFWWWEAIGQAWPSLQIPDMETLEQSGRQRITNERRPAEHRHDNSLYAANISRNLLLGYRPERQQDLTKLRELVWAEVKRLLGKKRHGKLVVEPESPEHLYDA